ncbi:hypothetical protein [Asticcacaulis sp. 201]|uniref:hypothetical protein n=1 Tax=Asticcacaulis sp. 201 TaxID=3028787 RepID=UPI00291628E1|nr:hypothetical protein [Asticcacaulis sp. 201]MDV6329994.1 hypothetical protein [Asticcacaulis sp. 201]
MIFALVVALGCGAAGQLYASDETFLKRAVWSEDRAWLLSDSGQMFSVAEKDTAPRFEYAGANVLDMCVADGQVRVLVQKEDYPYDRWQLRHREGGQWVDDTAIPVEQPKPGEAVPPEPMAMVCDGGGVTILTHDRLLTVTGGKIAGIGLVGKTGFGIATVLATPHTLYVGYNKGEWGGGLQSIDRVSGAVKRIEKDGGGDSLCVGPLNTDCDPVNGLVPSPWHADCVVASIGLIHMAPHGRVVEVCDGDIRRVYFKNDDDGFGGNKDASVRDPSGEGYSTVAFYGLAVDGKDVLAIGMDGLYHVQGDGTAVVEPLPKFTKIAPFWLNFDRQGMVLVMTSINRRAAVGGATPMLISRPH